MAKYKIIEKIKCHICGTEVHRNENDPPIGFCPVCVTDLMTKNEILINKVKCSHKVKSNSAGFLYLTDRRLIWTMVVNETSTTFILFGLVGLLVERLLGGAGKTGGVNITMQRNFNLSDIDTAEEYKHGLIIRVNGENYQFKSKKLFEIRAAIEREVIKQKGLNA